VMRASAWESTHGRYQAPVAATQKEPVRYEARSMCGKGSQTTGLKTILLQSVATRASLSTV
jgi:hypothetical protein